jgi:glucose/arabinose dehydrogenase
VLRVPRGGLKLEATGLRNPFGLAFADDGRLPVTDNARDDLGAFRPPEELDAFDPAWRVPDFGFPACYGQGGPACAASVAPLTTLPAHASSDGVAIKGDDVYVAENGSSFAANPTGSDVQHNVLGGAMPTRFWRSPLRHDPLGAAIGPDDDLYVTLFVSGRVVRFDI